MSQYTSGLFWPGIVIIVTCGLLLLVAWRATLHALRRGEWAVTPSVVGSAIIFILMFGLTFQLAAGVLERGILESASFYKRDGATDAQVFILYSATLFPFILLGISIIFSARRPLVEVGKILVEAARDLFIFVGECRYYLSPSVPGRIWLALVSLFASLFLYLATFFYLAAFFPFATGAFAVALFLFYLAPPWEERRLRKLRREARRQEKNARNLEMIARAHNTNLTQEQEQELRESKADAARIRGEMREARKKVWSLGREARKVDGFIKQQDLFLLFHAYRLLGVVMICGFVLLSADLHASLADPELVESGRAGDALLSLLRFLAAGLAATFVIWAARQFERQLQQGRFEKAIGMLAEADGDYEGGVGKAGLALLRDLPDTFLSDKEKNIREVLEAFGIPESEVYPDG